MATCSYIHVHTCIKCKQDAPDLMYIICLTETEQTPAEATGPDGDAPQPHKKGLKLTYEEYKQIANLVVLYMRKQEEEAIGN